MPIPIVPTSSATFTITRENEQYYFDPPETFVLNGNTASTVTLVVGGAEPALTIDALLLSNHQSYTPFVESPPPYDAAPDPGTPYELGQDVIQTGYLAVQGATTAVPGVIVPVRQMWIEADQLAPAEVDVAEEGLLQLTWMLESPPDEGEVELFDSADKPFALFGGTSNRYPVSNAGTVYKAQGPEGSYQIFRVGVSGVKGTINVKRRIREEEK